MIGGNSYKATIDTEATASFVSEELAHNIAASNIVRHFFTNEACLSNLNDHWRSCFMTFA